MDKKTLYISIPVKGCEKWSLRESRKAQDFYSKKGFKVYNPNELLRKYHELLAFSPSDFQEIKFTMRYLLKSDIMVLFPEYPRSLRCNAEIAMAQKFNIPVLRVYSGGVWLKILQSKDILENVQTPSDMFLFSNININ